MHTAWPGIIDGSWMLCPSGRRASEPESVSSDFTELCELGVLQPSAVAKATSKVSCRF